MNVHAGMPAFEPAHENLVGDHAAGCRFGRIGLTRGHVDPARAADRQFVIFLGIQVQENLAAEQPAL